ncbi:MAG: hypothetical protein L6W00_10570 [Lentisphaeria bacterium]|nr:MAG: hypothetical protein L6W00_10570 [Lentisphaeria bacterium]
MANKLVDSIQMEVRSTQPCRKEFDFTVPADVVKGETANTLREIAAQVSLPGFRPGKAPVGLIRSKFENELKDELQRKLIYAAFELAGKDEANDIVTCGVEGKPELKFDEEFKFTIGADVAPEFEVGDYKSVKVEIPVDAVTDEQVEERVKFYRSAYGNYTEVEGPAQAEDMLKVNYKSDFAAPEDASAAVKRQLEAENTFLWLSEPETIPGCIAALTGAKRMGSTPLKRPIPPITAKRRWRARRSSTPSKCSASSAGTSSTMNSSPKRHGSSRSRSSATCSARRWSRRTRRRTTTRCLTLSTRSSPTWPGNSNCRQMFSRRRSRRNFRRSPATR